MLGGRTLGREADCVSYCPIRLSWYFYRREAILWILLDSLENLLMFVVIFTVQFIFLFSLRVLLASEAIRKPPTANRWFSASWCFHQFANYL